MQTQTILAWLLLLAVLAPAAIPQATAQATPYSIRVQNPIVFISSELVVFTTGPNNTLFTVDMVNMTHPGYTYSVYGGMFNDSGVVIVTRLMTEGLYPAGRYWLNLSVDGNLMSSTQISLVYNEKFILLERIKDIVGELTALWGAIRVHDSEIEDLQSRQWRTDWLLFTFGVASIVIFWIVFYTIILRIIKVKFACWNERAAYAYRKKHGLECAPIIWSDLEQGVASPETAPNLAPIPQVLKKLGVHPALASECLWDCRGDYGMALLMEKELSWGEKRKLNKDAARKAKYTRGG